MIRTGPEQHVLMCDERPDEHIPTRDCLCAPRQCVAGQAGDEDGLYFVWVHGALATQDTRTHG